MSFLHKREYLEEGDVVVVNCSHQCNIHLTDDQNFQSYRSGRQFRYFGGFYKILPARIAAPHSGYWNISLDLGGGSASVRHSISIIKKN
ncbi:DUF1883 domain-containing protein [Burkholderia sp. D-99]|uniref:DUF1883 domain-containing protein n=1 Tax=Burkholderia sp. D-99 TaxID=2717316 RepID=UPI0014217550|nr:DUF1883 domain-containing protein [Burkholderia sp. D-99]NHV31739.1 DUF1883 domain-containing protein [Burkholderia sp. D-99]